MVELLERARARGEIGANVDLEFAAELFFGALWYRLLAGSGAVDRAFADQMTDLLLELGDRGVVRQGRLDAAVGSGGAAGHIKSEP